MFKKEEPGILAIGGYCMEGSGLNSNILEIQEKENPAP